MTAELRIAFDEQIFLRQRFGGVSRYICSLADTLNHRADTSARIFAPLHINQHLASMGLGVSNGHLIPLPNVFGRGPMIRAFRAISAYIGTRQRRSFSPHILHETYFTGQAPKALGAARILTVYDMIHELFPKQFGPTDKTTQYKYASVQRADRVICISESTRRDLIRLFGIAEDKAVVVHLGFDPLPEPEAHERLTFADQARPYVLYVGQRDGYKNFDGLLRAYAASSQLRENFRLMCFGGGSLSRKEQDLIAELGLDPNCVLQRAGDDGELASCYRNAALFVYPSLYEGFGIPPLEAMSLGCPVACSQTSSIPEVVGDAAVLFDPSDIDGIRHAMESVLESTSLSNTLVQKGQARSALFSWEECARKTVDVYRQVV